MVKLVTNLIGFQGEWETADVSLDAQKYTIESLTCGSRYQVYATGYNSIGKIFHISFNIFQWIFKLNCNFSGSGEQSDILNLRTKGSKPILPEKSRFIEVSSNSITLHLPAWKDGGCRMSHFVVEHRKKWVLFIL